MNKRNTKSRTRKTAKKSNHNKFLVGIPLLFILLFLLFTCTSLSGIFGANQVIYSVNTNETENTTLIIGNPSSFYANAEYISFEPTKTDGVYDYAYDAGFRYGSYYWITKPGLLEEKVEIIHGVPSTTLNNFSRIYGLYPGVQFEGTELEETNENYYDAVHITASDNITLTVIYAFKDIDVNLTYADGDTTFTLIQTYRENGTAIPDQPQMALIYDSYNPGNKVLCDENGQYTFEDQIIEINDETLLAAGFYDPWEDKWGDDGWCFTMISLDTTVTPSIPENPTGGGYYTYEDEQDSVVTPDYTPITSSRISSEDFITIISNPTNWIILIGAYIGAFIITIRLGITAINAITYGTITWVLLLLIMYIGINPFIINILVFNDSIILSTLNFIIYGGIASILITQVKK